MSFGWIWNLFFRHNLCELATVGIHATKNEIPTFLWLAEAAKETLSHNECGIIRIVGMFYKINRKCHFMHNNFSVGSIQKWKKKVMNEKDS